ncbi:MAG: hypothetical protein AAF340_17910 [Pseudomonadota bacterium]
MKHILACLFMLPTLVTPAFADQALAQRFYTSLQLGEMFEILRDEGMEAAEELARDDEAISPSSAWTSRIERIYDVERMEALFEAALLSSENFELSDEALAFFESTLGKRIVEVEIYARKSLVDEAVEEAVREQAKSLKESEPDRVAAYQEFIDVNGFIDNNLAGALNSNLAFYRGLASHPEFRTMDESTMFEQVYQQAEEIRRDMVDWTMNFSVLAYSVLSLDEMQNYIDSSETKSGQALNSALFAGFDEVFEYHSYELGRAMAEFMAGDET